MRVLRRQGAAVAVSWKQWLQTIVNLMKVIGMGAFVLQLDFRPAVVTIPLSGHNLATVLDAVMVPSENSL